MRVEVTQADIDAGVRYNATQGPVAQAMLRATGKTSHRAAVVVTGHRAYLCPKPDDQRQTRWLLPRAIGDWIAAWDLGKPVEPFAFEAALDNGHTT